MPNVPDMFNIEWLETLLATLALIFWLWMLIDCIMNQRLSGSQRIVWVLVIIFLNGLGALIYYFVGRSA